MSDAFNTGGARQPRNRTLMIVLAVVGGLVLCSCAGCLGIAVVSSRNGGSATATPGSAIAIATATPARSAAPSSAAGVATATAAPIVVSGCGGGSVQLGFDRQLRADLDQWNRVVDHANIVTRAWNAFLTATNDLNYTQAAGNPAAIAASDSFLTTAQAELPALRTEAGTGRFATLAGEEVATIEAEVKFVTLYRKAVAESDKTAWNDAIDASDATDTARTKLQAEIDRQCDFWRSHR